MKSGLFARLAWGFGLGLLLLHLGTGVYHAHDSLVQQAANFTVAQIDRVRLIGQLTDVSPPLLQRLSSESFRVHRADAPPTPQRQQWRHQQEIENLVAPQLAALGVESQHLRYGFTFGRGGPRLQLALQAGSDWLVADVRAEPARWQPRVLGMIWTTMFALLIFGIVLWATRRFTRFLPKFAAAAEQVGSFGELQPLPVRGPKEVRQASEAFNNMQQRLRQHERERGAMLGAFSHDIRTLVTRLTLRLDNIVDATERHKVQADLAGITHIVDEALAYSKDEVSTEPRAALDLISLLQTLVDDMPKVQLDVGDKAMTTLTLVAQPQALRRALLNVINNAVLYGSKASIQLAVEDSNVVIDVIDDGPGIPQEDQQRVLEPYVRLETSRNRATGGSGLGLAIANNVVLRHGGKLSFHSKQPGDGQTAGAGFRVRIALPLG